MKKKAIGISLWTRAFGTPTNDDRFYDIEQTADGGFVMAGLVYYPESGDEDVWLMRTGPDGTPVSEWRYPVPSGTCVARLEMGRVRQAQKIMLIR